MSLYVIDTDILSLLQHGNATVVAAILAAEKAGHTLALSVVTIEEQVEGWFKGLRTAKSPERSAGLVSQHFADAVPIWNQFKVYPETVASLDAVRKLLRAKLNVGKNDLRIASVALSVGATLVTHNLADFRRVPDLTIEDWAAPPIAPPAPP